MPSIWRNLKQPVMGPTEIEINSLIHLALYRCVLDLDSHGGDETPVDRCLSKTKLNLNLA